MHRLFGTDGVRGEAYTELTLDLAYKIGLASGEIFKSEQNNNPILIGRDTRVSGTDLERYLIHGFSTVDEHYRIISLGVIPTPALAYLTKKLNVKAAVMITASHNPYIDNGIKIFNGDGLKLSDDREDEIQKIIENELPNTGINYIVSDQLSSNEGLINVYLDHLLSMSKGNLKGLKIALDCANGATYKVAPQIFKILGAEVMAINCNPTGLNINEECGSTHIAGLQDFVLINKCDLGIAYDGDGDRCLAVDENGNIIDGDCIMAIVAKNLKEEGNLLNNALVVTQMSNLGMSKFCQNNDIDLYVTNVGDRYVAEKMRAINGSIGGEESGHVILSTHNTTGDGIATSIMLANIIMKKKQTLSQLSRIFTKYPQVLTKVQVPIDSKNIFITDVEIINLMHEVETKLGSNGRLLVRASGTEPVIRIMIEGTKQDEILILANEIGELIKEKVAVKVLIKEK